MALSGLGEPLVKDFITTNMSWDRAKLRSAVGGPTAMIICRTPLPQTPVADRLRFLGDALSVYSVGKACRLIAS